jgi:hypothetical protein
VAIHTSSTPVANPVQDIVTRLAGYFVAPAGAAVVTWAVLSAVIGETDSAKGCSFISFGLVLIAWDFTYRKRRSSHAWKWVFSTEDYVPSLYGIPLWFFGFVVCFGGVSIIFDH